MSGGAYNYIDKKLKNNEKIAMLAAKTFGSSLKFFKKDFKKNKKICLNAVNQYGLSLKFVQLWSITIIPGIR